MAHDDAVPAGVQAQVDQLLRLVDERVAADPDLVHGDVVEEVAVATEDLDVAVELCQQAMEGFVPDTVRRRVFERDNADTIARAAELTAERDAVAAKAAQRTQRAAATRAATLAKEAAAASAALRSATCPSCFQVRSPAGTCGCDE